ncbi:hypothetical protein N5J48_12415 [Acinetobacter ursingii]|uniref:hypothetical protein n=1 Tax=Acinetobacter TaxID=469 RepID=UPI000F6CE898|nr:MULTISPECIES: hypothetical protein [Acinetobacter]MDH0008371.1 hypothetical protein [Acinetobacter ursingii]MDH0480177.1 hypothetical protein [Acinetobacter ursingii]MDH2120785.1 hypothetical protein [Acinetobacter ursingii]MDH2128355.1 hypothetical protein [Acinetobacter ursingii]BBF76075.1 hypothetical protein URS_0019 [Acinetobacter ursingii]
MTPTDATYIENDGTYWKSENGCWYYWDEIFEWCFYVGPVNQMFFGNKREIGVNNERT